MAKAPRRELNSLADQQVTQCSQVGSWKWGWGEERGGVRDLLGLREPRKGRPGDLSFRTVFMWFQQRRLFL